MGSNPSLGNTVSRTVHALFTRDSYIILYCTYTENPGSIHKKKGACLLLFKKKILCLCVHVSCPFIFSFFYLVILSYQFL